MIKTESEPKEQMYSRVNDDVVNEMDDGQAVGSDYQDRDPLLDYWIHLHNKLKRKCDKQEDLKRGKVSLKDEKKFCKAWKKKVWYVNFPFYLANPTEVFSYGVTWLESLIKWCPS